MLNRKVVLLILLFCLINVLPAFARVVENEKSGIVVCGVGEQKVRPDMATLTVGVVVQKKNAKDCYNANNELMTRVKTALLAFGVAQNDVQTINISLGADYDYTNSKAKIVGYKMNHSFSVKVNDLDKLGSISDACIAAGANEITQVEFGAKAIEFSRSMARKLAIENAYLKAKTLAESANVKIGLPTYIEELSEAQGYEPRAMLTFAKADNFQAPIMPAELNVKVSVIVNYEIKSMYQ